MKRSLPLASLFLSALVVTCHDAGAQDRRQPQELDLQGSIDAVFGDIVTGLSYYPFYNIAGWMGLSTDAQFRLGENGQPVVESTVLEGHEGAVQAAVFAAGNASFGPNRTVLTLQ